MGAERSEGFAVPPLKHPRPNNSRSPIAQKATEHTELHRRTHWGKRREELSLINPQFSLQFSVSPRIGTRAGDFAAFAFDVGTFLSLASGAG